jgi:hypothetical protein
MGGGSAAAKQIQAAYELGGRIAEQGWVLLNGGRNAGIMAASAKGASDHGGITVGILPDADPSQAADGIQIPICTGMGSARNAINVLSCIAVVACPGGPGTISEIALALKHGKTVITMGFDTGKLFDEYRIQGRLIEVQTPDRVVAAIKTMIEP